MLPTPTAAIEQVDPAYAWWMRQRVMYPEKTLDENKLDEDADGIHLGLFANNELTSIASIFWRMDPLAPERKALQFRKFCTLQSAQGQGYGTQLLGYIMDYAREQGAWLVYANARRSALAFYARLGFAETGPTWQADGHDFVRIECRVAPDAGA